jgi:altronate dehydratase small subunit
LKQGEILQIKAGDTIFDITLMEDITFGHKLALNDIPQWSSVIKYGEAVGMATSLIKKGQHVHVHNVDGVRGRGDRL